MVSLRQVAAREQREFSKQEIIDAGKFAGLSPEDAKATLTPSEIQRFAAETRNVAAGIGTSRVPPSPTAVEQLTFARGIVEGTNLVGGVDLSDIQSGNLRDFGRRLAEDAGIDFESGGVTIQEIMEAGIPANALNPTVLDTFDQAGLTRGGQFIESNISQLQEGFFPGAKDIRQSLEQKALDAFGTGPPEEFGQARERALDLVNFDPFDTDDPFVAAELESLQQSIRGAFASRGLNQSGAAAFTESGEGIRLLEQIGQGRRAEGFNTIGVLDEFRRQQLNEGLGLVGAAQNLGTGGDTGQLGLSLQQGDFQESLGTFFLEKQIADQFRAQEVLRKSKPQFGDILEQNLAASLGSFLGNPLGSIIPGTNPAGGTVPPSQQAQAAGISGVGPTGVPLDPNNPLNAGLFGGGGLIGFLQS